MAKKGATAPTSGVQNAAKAVLKSRAPTPPGKKKMRPRLFKVGALTDAVKHLYAAAVVAHNNNRLAFEEVFGKDYPKASEPAKYTWIRQLNHDPVVRGAVQEILNAISDAKAGAAADKKRMAIEVMSALSNITRADHDEVARAIVGKPLEATRDLPEYMRGVVEEYDTHTVDGVVVIKKVKFHNRLKAAEVLARWAEMARSAGTAVSAAVEVMPADVEKIGAGGGVSAEELA